MMTSPSHVMIGHGLVDSDRNTETERSSMSRMVDTINIKMFTDDD